MKLLVYLTKPERDLVIEGVDDSKKLSALQRERLADSIRSQALATSIGIIHHEDIDRINILQATFLAMRRALEALAQQPEVRLDAVEIVGPERAARAAFGVIGPEHEVIDDELVLGPRTLGDLAKRRAIHAVRRELLQRCRDCSGLGRARRLRRPLVPGAPHRARRRRQCEWRQRHRRWSGLVRRRDPRHGDRKA